MRKTIIIVALSLISSSAFAGRGSSTSAIQSAIRSNNADAIISELERAERLVCGACVEPVMALLDHEDYRVREAAAWWFARRPAIKAEVFDLSVARLYAADSIEARNAADALGPFRHPDAITALTFASTRTDFSAEARAAAVKALGTIGSRLAYTAIVDALDDSDATVRAAAANAYAELRGTSTGDELAPLAGDPDVSVRRQAIAHLGRFATASARTQLEAALSDSDALVRRNAAWALGRIGDAASRPALQAVADNDESNVVRSIATAALRSLR
jgi:HEAT repeat protein